MTLWEWLVDFHLTTQFVIAIGSLGWLLGIACILSKYDRQKDRLSCLFSELAAATFTAVTFIGVILLSMRFELFLRVELPEMTENQRENVDRLLQECLVIRETTNRTNDVVEEALARPLDSLSSAMERLFSRSQNVTDAQVTEIVREHLGYLDLHGSIVFTTFESGVRVSCGYVDLGDGGGGALQCMHQR